MPRGGRLQHPKCTNEICRNAIQCCLLKDKGARQVADLAVTGYIGA